MNAKLPCYMSDDGKGNTYTVKQLLPADGWHVVYMSKQGGQSRVWVAPLIAWAFAESDFSDEHRAQDVFGVYLSGDGIATLATNPNGYVRNPDDACPTYLNADAAYDPGVTYVIDERNKTWKKEE